MDIHRCRFIPFPSSPINALAFSHRQIGEQDESVQPRLAVGRANGDIEIWNPLDRERWMQETVIHGGKDRSIDGLVWANDLDHSYSSTYTIRGRSRLFSIGYTSAITEWDLEKRTAKRHAAGQHGDIWCFALQPFSPDTLAAPSTKLSSEKRLLVAGTVDGSLVAYSIEDDDLRFEKVLVKTPKKSRMVSLAFQSRQVVVVGDAAGAVAVHNIETGWTRKLSLDYKTSASASKIVIWAVCCLPTGRRNIVVGDSTGHLSVFSGANYTLLQRVHAHKQDVLSLAVTQDGTTLASGGMDRRTCIYRRSPSSGRWNKLFHNRDHKHDVKAMTSFSSPGADVFVTGGPDTCPIVVPAATAGQEPRRTLPHLPQTATVATAPKARLVVAWWNREVRIWKLKRTVKENMLQQPDLDGKVDENHKFLSHILVKGEADITSASISQDGSLLVVATSLEAKAFRLRLKLDANGNEILRPSKIELPEALLSTGYTRVEISPDGKWICMVGESGQVCMAKIIKNDDRSISMHPKLFHLHRLSRKIPKSIKLGGLGSYDRGVAHIAFSPDSKMVATADLAGYIDTWVLKDAALPNDVNQDSEDEEAAPPDSNCDQEDISSDRKWTLNPNASLIPKLPSPPAVLSFSSHVPHVAADQKTEEEDYILLAVTGSGHMLAFHPTLGGLTPWTKRNPLSIFPEEYTKTMEIAKGVVWHGNRVWIWGVSFVFMIDMSKNFKAPPTLESGEVLVPAKGKKRKKRKEDINYIPMVSKSVKVHKPSDDPHEWKEIGDKHVELPGAVAKKNALPAMENDALPATENDVLPAAEKDDADKPVVVLDEKARGLFWATRRYRPILGLLPIGEDDPGSKEAVLIERPLWDVEMPDRYFDDEEWERY